MSTQNPFFYFLFVLSFSKRTEVIVATLSEYYDVIYNSFYKLKHQVCKGSRKQSYFYWQGPSPPPPLP